MQKQRIGVMLVAFACMASGVALAQSSSAGNIGLRGWGPRVGLASDPDQVLAGVHFDLGEFANNIAFQPDVVVGFGDDATALVGSAPVWYRFRVDSPVRPYAGGALAIGWFDFDGKGHKDDDSDVEIGLQVGGGGEWNLKGGNRFHVELRLDLADVWDLAVFAGWTF